VLLACCDSLGRGSTGRNTFWLNTLLIWLEDSILGRIGQGVIAIRKGGAT
jgi:hypothetical protein